MVEVDVSEKRYKGNKYIYCYCDKHDQVLVGTEIYKYINIFADIGGPSLTLLIIFSEVDISYKLFFILIFVVPVITLTLLNYGDAKKEMLSAGHSDDCSAKIARMVTYRASLWGDKLRIMKSKDDGIRVGYGFERLKW
jgi:hypothetical protein